MAPEQARGKPVDKRADIWAFGVVLFEMLTGKRLFDGETVSDVLAAVLTREPTVERAALGDSAPGPPLAAALPGAQPEEPPARHRRRARGTRRGTPGCAGGSGCRRAPAARAARVASVAVGGRGCVGPGLLLGRWAPWKPPAQAAKPVRLSVELGADMSLATTGFGVGTAVTLSPDGSLLAFVAQRAAGGRPQQLYLRRLEELQAPRFPARKTLATRSSRPTGSGSRSSPAASSRRWRSSEAPPSRCAMRPTTAAEPGSTTGRSSLRLRAEAGCHGCPPMGEHRKS